MFVPWFAQPGEDEWDHLCALVDYALAMKTRLDEVNKHSFNAFHLRVGKSGFCESRAPKGQIAHPFWTFWTCLPSHVQPSRCELGADGVLAAAVLTTALCCRHQLRPGGRRRHRCTQARV